jgi:hypothetical protein
MNPENCRPENPGKIIIYFFLNLGRIHDKIISAEYTSAIRK